MLTRLSFLFLCLFIQDLRCAVRIITFHCNHPEFLEYQCKSLEKFLRDDYELIVMNDGVNSQEHNAIKALSQKYGALNVTYEQHWHRTDPLNKKIKEILSRPHFNDFFNFDMKKIYEHISLRHCHLIQYALDQFGYDHDDVVVIMDGDAFLVQPLSIRSLLTETPLVGIDSDFKDRHYLWVPFVAFEPKRLPNVRELKFHMDNVEGVICDTGSNSYHYLKNHPEVPFQLYSRHKASDFAFYGAEDFSKIGLSPLAACDIEWQALRTEFYIDYHLIHFYGGSTTNPKQRYQAMAKIMGAILEEELPVVQTSHGMN